MFYFSRGGTRGGRDQFDWESVKGDKHKEYYLGNSLKTVRPTFNCPKPNTGWWTEKKGISEEERTQAELAEIKRKEAALMGQALGHRPKEQIQSMRKLDSVEIAELTKRGETEHGGLDIDRVEGLGFAPSFTHEPSIAPTKIEGNVEEEEFQKPKFISPEEEKDREIVKLEKKRRKQEKKERKKERKERRKEKKRKRRRHDSDEEDMPERKRRRHDSLSPSPVRKNRRKRHDSDEDTPKRKRRRHDSISPSPVRKYRSPGRQLRDSDESYSDYRRSTHYKRDYSGNRRSDRYDELDSPGQRRHKDYDHRGEDIRPSRTHYRESGRHSRRD